MHPDLFRPALRTPGLTRILEVPHKLFLLGVNRDHRLASSQCTPHARVEMLELCVTIRMIATLAGLAIGLQTKFLLVQQFSDDGAPDLVPLGRQGSRQLRQVLARPAQWRHRIATGIRLDKRQQFAQQRDILVHQLLAAAPKAVGPDLDRACRAPLNP